MPHAPSPPVSTNRKRPSFRERMNAMRNLPPFLRQIWQTSPALTLASLCLRLVRALLPVAMLYVGKLIIDEAVRLAGAGAMPPLGEAWASGHLDLLLELLAQWR